MNSDSPPDFSHRQRRTRTHKRQCSHTCIASACRAGLKGVHSIGCNLCHATAAECCCNSSVCCACWCARLVVFAFVSMRDWLDYKYTPVALGGAFDDAIQPKVNETTACRIPILYIQCDSENDLFYRLIYVHVVSVSCARTVTHTQRIPNGKIVHDFGHRIRFFSSLRQQQQRNKKSGNRWRRNQGTNTHLTTSSIITTHANIFTFIYQQQRQRRVYSEWASILLNVVHAY